MEGSALPGKRLLMIALFALACETQVPPDPTPSVLVDEGDFWLTGVDSSGRIYALGGYYYINLVRYTDTSEEVFLEDVRCFHIKGNFMAAGVYDYDNDRYTLLMYDLRTDALIGSALPEFRPEVVGVVDSDRVLVVPYSSGRFYLWNVKTGQITYLFDYYWEDEDDYYYSSRSFDVSWPLVILDNGELLDSGGTLLENWDTLGHDFVFWPGADSILVFCSEVYPGYLGRLNRKTGQLAYYYNKVAGLSDAKGPSVSPDEAFIAFCANHGNEGRDEWGGPYPTDYYLWKYPLR